MRDDLSGVKWLPAGRLVELLSTLPPDSRVMPNAVGNLLVMDPGGSKNISYVDLVCGGEVVSMEGFENA